MSLYDNGSLMMSKILLANTDYFIRRARIESM